MKIGKSREKSNKRLKDFLSGKKSYTIGVSIIVLVVLFVLYKVSMILYNNYQFINVSGSIVNASTGRQYTDGNLTAEVIGKKIDIGTDGTFTFVKVPRNGVIIISGPSLYSELKVHISGQKKLTVLVDSSMEKFFLNYIHSYRYRKFRDTYEILDRSYKSKLSVDDFLKSENELFDKMLKNEEGKSCKIKTVSFENVTKSNEKDELNADLIVTFEDTCSMENFVRQVIIVNRENDGWRWMSVE